MFFSNDESGFTLLEILIAVTILTVALIGMAGLLATNVKSVSRGKHQLIALNLAQEQLEDVKMLASSDFDDPVIDDTLINNNPLVQGTAGDIIEVRGSIVGYTLYSRNTYIEDDPVAVANGETVNRKDVAVIVDWTDVSGPHNIMVRTIIAR